LGILFYIAGRESLVGSVILLSALYVFIVLRMIDHTINLHGARVFDLADSAVKTARDILGNTPTGLTSCCAVGVLVQGFVVGAAAGCPP
jgi:hypothetical protein